MTPGFTDTTDRNGRDARIQALPQVREARSYFAQALSIARDINTPVEEARALEGIGRCHIQKRNPGQGTADLRQALAIYRRIGAPEAQRVETTLLT